MSNFTQADRQKWLGILARAAPDRLNAAIAELPELPASADLRGPEVGMVMIRGRVGGSGEPFNLGEMTVTRCSVTAEGRTGHALVHGRRPEHARFAALADCLLQDESWAKVIRTRVIEPLEAQEEHDREAKRAAADATRVDFFTMVRGEDEK